MTDATMSFVGRYGNSPISGANVKPGTSGGTGGGPVEYNTSSTTGDKIVVSEGTNADTIKESAVSINPANGGITTPTTAINNLQGTTNFPNGSTQNFAGNSNFQTGNTVTGTENFGPTYTANYTGSTINYNDNGVTPTTINNNGHTIVNNSSNSVINNNGNTINNTGTTVNYDNTSVVNLPSGTTVGGYGFKKVTGKTWAGPTNSLVVTDADCLPGSVIMGWTVTAGSAIGFRQITMGTGSFTINSTSNESGLTFNYVIMF